MAKQTELELTAQQAAQPEETPAKKTAAKKTAAKKPAAKKATTKKTTTKTKAAKTEDGETAAEKPAAKRTTKKTEAKPGTKLVIVESPAKAKTIGKYLGRGYTVTASMGHIRDLPASTLGIDVEHGYTPKYIDSKFDDIVEFSELQEFLDVPLKNYSSGMVARLAFAVATMTKPDILIADEILSVGDFLFQEKCEKRMAELLSGGTTVILVSHSIEQIERMCNKVAWLDHGHLRRLGPTKEVTAEYRKFEKKDAMKADKVEG